MKKITKKEIKRAIDAFEKSSSIDGWSNETSKKIIDVYSAMKERIDNRKLAQREPSMTDIINMVHYHFELERKEYECL
jgi:hypothetical protein